MILPRIIQKPACISNATSMAWSWPPQGKKISVKIGVLKQLTVLLISYRPICAKRLVPYKSLYLVIFDIYKADFSTNRRRIVSGT